MKKLLGGGIIAGLAATGALAFALPSSAQEGSEVTVNTPTIEQSQPLEIEGGGCLDANGAAGFVNVVLEGPGGTINPTERPQAQPDGSWSQSIQFLGEGDEPIPFPPGEFTGITSCTNEDGSVIFNYADFTFTVVPDPGATTTTVPAPEEPPAAPPAEDVPQGDREPTG